LNLKGKLLMYLLLTSVFGKSYAFSTAEIVQNVKLLEARNLDASRETKLSDDGHYLWPTLPRKAE